MKTMEDMSTEELLARSVGNECTNCRSETLGIGIQTMVVPCPTVTVQLTAPITSVSASFINKEADPDINNPTGWRDVVSVTLYTGFGYGDQPDMTVYVNETPVITTDRPVNSSRTVSINVPSDGNTYSICGGITAPTTCAVDYISNTQTHAATDGSTTADTIVCVPGPYTGTIVNWDIVQQKYGIHIYGTATDHIVYLPVSDILLGSCNNVAPPLCGKNWVPGGWSPCTSGPQTRTETDECENTRSVTVTRVCTITCISAPPPTSPSLSEIDINFTWKNTGMEAQSFIPAVSIDGGASINLTTNPVTLAPGGTYNVPYAITGLSLSVGTIYTVCPIPN